MSNNEDLLAWLRKQSDGPPPPDLLLPKTNDGRASKPFICAPGASVGQRPSPTISVSIWDKSVEVHNRERPGTYVAINGGRLDKIEELDLWIYDGFTIVLAGGEELRFYSEGVSASTNKTGSMLTRALKPYKGDPVFFGTIEGPLLVVLWWLKRKGITATEVRLLKEDNNGTD